MGKYTGKKAVVTGGTHSMGLAIVKALLEGGAEVLLTGRNEQNLPHIVKFSGAESGVGFDVQAFSSTRQHEEIERYLKMSGVSWTILRPSQFMQMYLFEPPSVARNKALIRPMGAAKLSPTDIEDIAKIAVALLRQGGHEGRSYDMTGPKALSMADVAEQISQAVGDGIPYLDIAPERYRQALDQAGAPPLFADILEEIYAERRKHPESRVELAAHEVFGVRPTSFAEFAARGVAQHSEVKGAGSMLLL